FVREATRRTVSAVIASSRSSAVTKRASALETILLVTTRMSPRLIPGSARSAASPMIVARSSPAAISPMPFRPQICSMLCPLPNDEGGHRRFDARPRGRSPAEPDLRQLLAEERLGAVGAVEGEAALGVERFAAGVVLGDPSVERLAVVDDRLEELAADALAVPRVEEEDEVELARGRCVVVARRARRREADDLAVDEGRGVAVFRGAGGVARPQLGETLGGDGLEGRQGDHAVVGLVPDLGVSLSHLDSVDVADGADQSLELCCTARVGAHGASLLRARARRESRGRI